MGGNGTEGKNWTQNRPANATPSNQRLEEKNPQEERMTIKQPAKTGFKTRIQIVVAGVLAASLLAACSSGTSSSGTSSPTNAAAKPKQIHILYATAEANSAAVQAVLPGFKAKTGVELVMDTMPYNALQTKVFSEFASKSAYYDVVIVDTPWSPALVQHLEPLSSYITNPSLNDLAPIDQTDFIPKVFYDTAVYDVNHPSVHYPDVTVPVDATSIKKNGFDVYGLPIQANALSLAYRKDLFEDPAQKAAFKRQYGRDLLVPKTLDEFKQVAKFFTQPGKNLYGTTLMAGTGDWATDDFKTLLAAFGGNGYMIGNKQELDFNSAAGVKALTYYRELIKSGVTPPGTTSASWDEVATMFDSGLTAMTMNYHDLKLDAKIKGGVIGYAKVPAGSSEGPHFGTWMLSLNKYSTNKEWGYRAAEWLTSTGIVKSMLANGIHPARNSVYEATSSLPDANIAAYYATLKEALTVGDGRPRLTNYGEVDAAIFTMVNEVASGKLDPKQGIDQAAAAVRKLLKTAGYTVPN
jgi:multiple sugar transport system substrate-binding protein